MNSGLQPARVTVPQHSSGKALFLSSLVAVIPPALVWLFLAQKIGFFMVLFSAPIHFISYIIVGFFVFTKYHRKPGHWIWKMPYSLLMATLFAFLAFLIIATLILPGLKISGVVLLYTLLYGPYSGFAAWLLRPRRNT